MTDAGHCIHTSYIDTLREDARKEYERAEDWRDIARGYKQIVQWLLYDIDHKVLTTKTVDEAHAELRKVHKWVTFAARHLP